MAPMRSESGGPLLHTSIARCNALLMPALHTTCTNKSTVSVTTGSRVVYSQTMEEPIVKALRWAREKGMNQSAFADRVGCTPQDVTNWKKRGMPADWHARVATVLGRSVDELLSTKAAINGTTGQPMAQDLSQAPVETPLLTWEELMSQQLPEVFRVLLRDDVLAPILSTGDELVFRRASEARAGQLVLLRDREGNHFARVLRERLPGQYVAYSPNPAYEPLDVKALSLEIVGVLIYQSPARSWA